MGIPAKTAISFPFPWQESGGTLGWDVGLAQEEAHTGDGTECLPWMGLAAALCGSALVLPSRAHVEGRDGSDGCKGK